MATASALREPQLVGVCCSIILGFPSSFLLWAVVLQLDTNRLRETSSMTAPAQALARSTRARAGRSGRAAPLGARASCR